MTASSPAQPHPAAKRKHNRGIWILIVFLVLLAALIGWYFWYTRPVPLTTVLGGEPASVSATLLDGIGRRYDLNAQRGEPGMDALLEVLTAVEYRKSLWTLFYRPFPLDETGSNGITFVVDGRRINLWLADDADLCSVNDETQRLYAIDGTLYEQAAAVVAAYGA